MAQELIKILEKSKIQKSAKRDPNIVIRERGIILYWELIYMPAKFQEQLIKNIHKAPAYDHQKMDKIIE